MTARMGWLRRAALLSWPRRAALCALCCLALAAPAAANSAPDAAESARARINWLLNCQGCHRADASGLPGGAPNMAGEVSRFLNVKGGREYLVRVPGVANAPLSDADLAALLNWMLRTFDPQHLPKNFHPYAAAEVATLRRHPLLEEAPTLRATLTSTLAFTGEESR
ncbi:MAG: cytochrome c [Deltaproteobacteria bacterium]|nr:cytochrome c [Deltaproteobacteria bacterium]